MENIAFYSPCFCLSNRVWHGQIISCTVVIYPNYFKCLGTIFAIFWLQKKHYFLERTHQISSNVSAARCRLLLLLLRSERSEARSLRGSERKNNKRVRVRLVKVQFRGPELYKKKGALFQEESYLPRIFRSSSLSLHTFHLIHIVFWIGLILSCDKCCHQGVRSVVS